MILTPRRNEIVRRTIRDARVLIYGVNYYPVASSVSVSWQTKVAYIGQLDGMKGIFRASHVNTPNRIPNVSFHGIVGIPLREQPNIINGTIRWSLWLPSAKHIIHLHRVSNKIIGHWCKQLLLRHYMNLYHPLQLTDEDVSYIKGLAT